MTLPTASYSLAPLPTNTTDDFLLTCHSYFPNALKICGGAKASNTALWNSLAEEPLMTLSCPSLERWAAARCDECQCVMTDDWPWSSPVGREGVEPRSKLPSLSSVTVIFI